MKRLILCMAIFLILTGCTKKVETTNTEESVQTFKGEDYYKMIDKGRGTNSENFYLEFSGTKDMINIGSGMQRLSAEHFSTDSYYLSEGRQLTMDDYNQLKRRDAKGTKKKDKQYPYTLQVEHGVTLDGVKDPVMVDNITELDFYKKSATSYKLKALSIAIILDPRDAKNNTLEKAMSTSTIKSFSQEVIEKMYKFLRERKEDLKDLPVMIAVYMANDNNESFVNGHFIYKAYCNDGNVGKMKKVTEETVIFTSTRAEKLDPTTYTDFESIKAKLKNAATEAAGLVGEARYIDKKIHSMTITAHLNVKTYTELLYLTSVIANSIDDGFTNEFTVKTLIYSQDELMAVIVKNSGSSTQTTIIN